MFSYERCSYDRAPQHRSLFNIIRKKDQRLKASTSGLPEQRILKNNERGLEWLLGVATRGGYSFRLSSRQADREIKDSTSQRAHPGTPSP